MRNHRLHTTFLGGAACVFSGNDKGVLTKWLVGFFLVSALYKALTTKQLSENVSPEAETKHSLVLYETWTFKDDPRNEHSFSFRIAAPTETEALALGERMVLTFFPEYVMTHSSVQSLAKVEASRGYSLGYLPFLSTQMSEAELSRRMTAYRKKRDSIPPAARAYNP